MHKELIQRLRETSMDFGEADHVSVMLLEAADAIEELSYKYEKALSDLIKQAEPKWIPVTERLPEAERKSYWVCTDTGYQCECRWINNRFGVIELDEWGWSIFDIPQYQKVMAWMDLPEPYKPPKEDG